MKILALEHDCPGVTAGQFKPHLGAEARRVWELQQAGVLREIYFRSDRHASVILLECPDVDEARRVLGTLPLVQEGLIQFEVIPLIPYPGLARLFSPGSSGPAA